MFGRFLNSIKSKDYLLTASFKSLPALKVGRFDAGILIFSPVRGLRPVVAARFDTENVPKPTRRTSSPFFKVPLMLDNTASRASCAFVFDRSACLATASIRSDLFMGIPLLIKSFLENLCPNLGVKKETAKILMKALANIGSLVIS